MSAADFSSNSSSKTEIDGIVHFDATARRRAENSNGAASVNDSRLSADVVEAYLVNFVVEQTGYPREIVELNADLEADLGIDSIKKAQLLGEAYAHFGVTPVEVTSLDAYPTLRSIQESLLADEPGSGA